MTQPPDAIEQVEPTKAMVEQFARAMFDEWPLHAVSQALAEQTGQPLGTPLTYDNVLEMGGDHNGLLRLAKGAAKLHARLTAMPAPTTTKDDLELALTGCSGLWSNSTGQGSRIVIFFHEVGQESALFHLLNEALSETPSPKGER